jgi:hypothetical protein
MVLAMRSGEGVDEVIPALLEEAQKLAGTIGFVVSSVRPDANFAYVAIARYVNAKRITRRVFLALVRVARYLLGTVELSLTLRPQVSGRNEPMRGFSDSSHGNAEGGRSYGGLVVLNRGGGALTWATVAPRPGDDSPGAAELRIITYAYKRILGIRTLLADLDLGVEEERPTPLWTDSKSAAQGQACERIDKNSRWMATRYAMVRWGIECGTIDLLTVEGSGNCADIFTKALVGASF